VGIGKIRKTTRKKCLLKTPVNCEAMIKNKLRWKNYKGLYTSVKQVSSPKTACPDKIN
jgi:hypothetical protein